MNGKKYRVLVIGTHPVQYTENNLRLLARHPKIELLVAFCSLQGVQSGVDPEFGVEVAWDVPLLQGYPWVCLPNRSFRPGLNRFFGLLNPGLWKLVRRGNFDAIVAFTGYRYASFWIAAAAAKFNRTPLLFGTDAHDFTPRDGRRWKLPVKKWAWPRLFRMADVMLVPSSGGVALMHALGLPPERVVLTPYVVHNEWWIEQASKVDRTAVRSQWGIPQDAPVALFCAKLQPWQRPQDLLRAFAKAGVPGTYLVYAGEGPLRPALEFEAQSLGVAERVRFLGFVNQSGLPDVYRSSDLIVLPSEYEPFGVVINEAMLSGCAAIVSDRVGARLDLVREGETGFVFPCGNVDTLAELLRHSLRDNRRGKQLGEAARRRMDTWTPVQIIAGFVKAIQIASQMSAQSEKREQA